VGLWTESHKSAVEGTKFDVLDRVAADEKLVSVKKIIETPKDERVAIEENDPAKIYQRKSL